MFERALDGDRDAQADLWVEYGDQMRRCIQIRLRQLKIAWAVEPNDVFGSFFVRIIEGRVKRRFASPEHFVNYCESALRNRCLRTLRSVILRMATNIADCPPELFDDPSATDDLESFSWHEQLENAYAQLTHLERVVCFYRIDGQTWQEIGERLGKSADAARKIHQRAAERLGSEILAGGEGTE
ncbi:MAG: sigma-70 family RNA polymerase sigma factor [Planctomycetota bacterium]|nr:sigma-70 family RNA polymerase sigma factor [Planctomycetota bacterium]